MLLTTMGTTVVTITRTDSLIQLNLCRARRRNTGRKRPSISIIHTKKRRRRREDARGGRRGNVRKPTNMAIGTIETMYRAKTAHTTARTRNIRRSRWRTTTNSLRRQDSLLHHILQPLVLRTTHLRGCLLARARATTRLLLDLHPAGRRTEVCRRLRTRRTVCRLRPVGHLRCRSHRALEDIIAEDTAARPASLRRRAEGCPRHSLEEEGSSLPADTLHRRACPLLVLTHHHREHHHLSLARAGGIRELAVVTIVAGGEVLGGSCAHLSVPRYLNETIKSYEQYQIY